MKVEETLQEATQGWLEACNLRDDHFSIRKKAQEVSHDVINSSDHCLSKG